jgi:hypothetical protein
MLATNRLLDCNIYILIGINFKEIRHVVFNSAYTQIYMYVYISGLFVGGGIPNEKISLMEAKIINFTFFT